MNFIRINCRLKELGEMQFDPSLTVTQLQWFITPSLSFYYPVSSVILNYSACLLPYTIYALLLSSKLIENGHVKNWRCETELTVTKSHPIPIRGRPLDRLIASLSFVARCVCMEIFFIINPFIHSHSLIRMWQEVSERQWVKGWVRDWGARPATRLTVGFVWLARWILIRSVLCECDRIIYY